MKTKLEMAHEYAIALINSDCEMQFDKFIRLCWNYADAMQAEADKREKEDQEKLKQDDRNHHDALVEIGLEEWQPDWSQAPADACCWFIGGKSWDVKPYWSKYIPRYKNEETQTTWQGDGMIEAPSFGYTGDWRNSLRKRPK